MRDLVRKAGRESEFEISSAAVSYEEEGNPIYPSAARMLESKGVPYNTAEYKRKTKDFRRPVLVSVYDGGVICSGVVRIVAEM